ncbi:3-isopropylmalate dehydratase large subunit [Xylophilus sp. GOD-11R]|uniref:3-isopropylmalate dehydratase large subunit n=1 Tax=Xylophilus sp. GOD-11R TaxID=3089814 RepID=UPI00298C4252|nr:3-isopropylmalate dehydratase large subunit [Xylophilus sp. GOD-11R]WPB57308.1 3-isopropylmalate dehydratase large subunit [Xylophilus sp. GOD-11R]
MSSTPRTLLDKIWADHVIEELGDGWALLHIDRQLLHDMSGSRGLQELAARGLKAACPELTFATPDHTVSTAPGRRGIDAPLWSVLREGTAAQGIRLFDLGESGQGIVHVMGPELGFVLPGTTVICGDSHTCTNGALGAMAFGVGASELMHALATQTLMQRKPKAMRIRFTGRLAERVTAKDLILHAIGRLGTAAGTGYAVEYAGEPIEAMTVEQRMTLCNLSIEMGAKIGMVAPDEKVYAYLRGRRFAPTGDTWDRAVDYWRSLPGDANAVFHRDETLAVDALVPQISWGTSPEQECGIDGHVPAPEETADLARREAWQQARDYMGLAAGARLLGQKVDRVFIGSCTNSRMTDLRDAASLLAGGRRVAPHVQAWVVPGSEDVKREAEAEGLDAIFEAAGFHWREPGCSMCVAANGETAGPAERVVSTSNRNFVGRQGPGARTHLASPFTAVASALAGEIADPREL